MRRFKGLIVLGLLLAAMPAVQAQQNGDLEPIAAANQQFIAAIGARDINAMDKVWAHESYASFIGPLSPRSWSAGTAYAKPGKCVFAKFDRVTIAMIAFLIGYESLQRLVDPVSIAFDQAIPIAVVGLSTC